MFVVASLHGDPRDVLLSQNARCEGACARASSQCYECFHCDPTGPDPTSTVASVDFTEKRRPPTLHEVESLNARNARRVCFVREEEVHAASGDDARRAAGILAVGDAERLMGFPEGWTEACVAASRQSTSPARENVERASRDKEDVDADAKDSEVTATNDASPSGRYPPTKDSAGVGRLPTAGPPGENPEAFDAEPSNNARAAREGLGTRTPTGMREEAHAEGKRARRERSAPARESGARDAEPDVGRSDEESDEGADELGITPEEVCDIVRVLLVASATATPQSRWIGERLADPYGAKFQRQRLGVAFDKEVLGGLDDPEGRAWPEAAWNVHPRGSVRPTGKVTSEGWQGRHALRDCSDSPTHLPFTPLGEFLTHPGAIPSAEAAAGYVIQLQIAHTDIPGFVMDALDPHGEASAGTTARWGGEKPHATELIPLEDLADLASAEPSIAPAEVAKVMPRAEDIPDPAEERGSNDGSNVGEGSVGETNADGDPAGKKTLPGEPETAAEKDEATAAAAGLEEQESGAEDEDNADDPLMVGTPVWAPWKLGKGIEHVLWPGIALHREKHKGVVPESAMKLKVKGATSESHRLVIFFGDRTYQWLNSSALHDYRPDKETFDKRMSQSVKRYSATFQRACEEARVWTRTWRRLRAAEEMRKRKRREARKGAREQQQTAAVNAAAATAAPNGIVAGLETAADEKAVCTPDVKAEQRTSPSETAPGRSSGSGAELPQLPRETYVRRESSPLSGSPGVFGIVDFGPGGYNGSLASSADPEPCGACRVCKARTPQAMRAAAVAAARGESTPDPPVRRHVKCPQVAAVRCARKGHTGALLALRRGGAVGERVRVLWDNDDRFYRGRVARFDPDAFAHDVEYDDGQLAIGLRLWNESLQTVDPASDPRPSLITAARYLGRDSRATAVGVANDTDPGRLGAGAKRKGGFEMEDRGGSDDTAGPGPKKRKSAVAGAAEAVAAYGDAGLVAAGAQRCEACARSHKGIAYCVARGHPIGPTNGAEHRSGGDGKGGVHSTGKSFLGGLDRNGKSELRADGAPRVVAKRGGNGKFVVSEGVGAALAAAGLEVPERCELCIRRKKGLSHCLKKGHIDAGPEANAVLARSGIWKTGSKPGGSRGQEKPPPKQGGVKPPPKQTRKIEKLDAGKTPGPRELLADSAGAVPNLAAITAAAAGMVPPPPPPGMSPADAAAAQAAAAAAMAAAMMGMGAIPVPMMSLAPPK